jgi:hypothetical protein
MLLLLFRMAHTILKNYKPIHTNQNTNNNTNTHYLSLSHYNSPPPYLIPPLALYLIKKIIPDILRSPTESNRINQGKQKGAGGRQRLSGLVE